MFMILIRFIQSNEILEVQQIFLQNGVMLEFQIEIDLILIFQKEFFLLF